MQPRCPAMSQLQQEFSTEQATLSQGKKLPERFLHWKVILCQSGFGFGRWIHAHMGMSMTRGAMVFMAFWRAAICFLMLSSSWCSLFWEHPQTGAGVGGGGGGRVGAGVGAGVGRGVGATNWRPLRSASPAPPRPAPDPGKPFTSPAAMAALRAAPRYTATLWDPWSYEKSSGRLCFCSKDACWPAARPAARTERNTDAFMATVWAQLANRPNVDPFYSKGRHPKILGNQELVCCITRTLTPHTGPKQMYATWKNLWINYPRVWAQTDEKDEGFVGELRKNCNLERNLYPPHKMLLKTWSPSQEYIFGFQWQISDSSSADAQIGGKVSGLSSLKQLSRKRRERRLGKNGKNYQLRGEEGEYFQDSRTKEMANIV